MSEIEELAEELFGDPDERGEFRQTRPERRREKRETDFMSDPSPDNPMSLDQFRRAVESDIPTSEPNGFRKNPEFNSMLECMEKLDEEYPKSLSDASLDIRFGGSLHEGHTWFDTVWIHYDDVAGRGLTGQDHLNFEEEMVLRFKSRLDEPSHGVCPMCDDRVNIQYESYRRVDSDPSLWASTNEFNFRENDEWGKYLRLWWDD